MAVIRPVLRPGACCQPICSFWTALTLPPAGRWGADSDAEQADNSSRSAAGRFISSCCARGQRRRRRARTQSNEPRRSSLWAFGRVRYPEAVATMIDLLQRMAQRGWKHGGPASEESIARIEKEFDITFPPDYRVYLAAAGGGETTAPSSYTGLLPVKILGL